jgi:hypothetical protein
MVDAVASSRDLGVTLKDAVLRHYLSYDMLEAFLRSNIGLWLNHITDRSVGLDQVAFELLKWAQSNGEDRLLLARLVASHPEDSVLTTLTAQIGIDPAAYPPKLAAFGALESAAADPATRQAFAPYRLDIENLCALAIEIRDWKFLHDGVDQIRNGTYAPLLAHTDANPMKRDKVEEIQFLTNGWVDSLIGRAAVMDLAAADTTWIDRRLKPANERLATVVPIWPSKPDHDFVMAMLSVVTTSDLAKLNQRIIAKAESIAALHILDKLALLKSKIAASSPDAAAIAADIGAVETGVATVLERNDIHNRWQTIKDELAPLRAKPERDDIVAQMAWEIIEPLLAQAADRPPLTDMIAGRIDAAFADPQSVALRESVEKLGGIVDQRFYAVDKDLLDAAEALGQIGSGLQKVLETLDG